MEQGTVRFVSTSVIKSKAQEEEEQIHIQRIELTPWDLQFLLVDGIQKGILFHKPSQPQPNLIHHLKTSLSRTLDHFPPLAGRLVNENYDDGSSSYYLTCNNGGAGFIHAVANGVTVADLLKPVYVPHITYSFFPLNSCLNKEGVAKPLLAVQVTELDDGYFIGVFMNHVVADGTTFWHFFNSWSEIARGGSITNPLVLNRWFLESDPPPIRFHLPEIDGGIKKKLTEPPLLKEIVFHYTKENIAKLKARANSNKIGGNNQISSLQAILSHIWRSVTRNRHLDPDLEIKYNILIGGRGRMNPPLPSHYLGNSLHIGILKMTVAELLDHGIDHVASKMNEMIVSQTEETARNFLETWMKNPFFLTVAGAMGNYSLTTGSSPRFNVYGNDFGWGKPVAVRSGGGNKADGKLTVFPGREEGSVDIEACLLAETLEAMVNDSDFMDIVKIKSY